MKTDTIKSTSELSSDLPQEECRVISPARIAIYDDFNSSPRIIDIMPDETKEFIGKLSSKIYEATKEAGGTIAYSVIKQITENYIHAAFNEMVISIFPGGKQIRFSDQGPGIENIENAFRPGFSTATRQMKKYIDGVGSGLPIAKEYLQTKNGEITIENNLSHGTVITIKEGYTENNNKIFVSNNIENINKNINITKRQVSILFFLNKGDLFGNKQIAQELNLPQSSVHNELNKLQDLNFVEKIGTKRRLTKFGKQYVNNLELSTMK